MNPGVLLSYMYLAILFTKENWFKVIPDVELSAWNITPVKLDIPQQPAPKLCYFVRRLRNALGHGSLDIHVPPGIKPQDFASRVTVTFRDRNTAKGKEADTFEAELSLEHVMHIARKFHELVLNDASKRYGQTPP